MICFLIVEYRSVNRYNYIGDNMFFNELLKEKGYTIYSLSKQSGIPKTTLFDICTGKSNIYDCRGRVLIKLAECLSISVETLLHLDFNEYNSCFEHEVPEFLKQDLNALKKCKNKKNNFIDCYLDETASSINVCEVENLISHEQADYLRNKYLRRRA